MNIAIIITITMTMMMIIIIAMAVFFVDASKDVGVCSALHGAQMMVVVRPVQHVCSVTPRALGRESKCRLACLRHGRRNAVPALDDISPQLSA